MPEPKEHVVHPAADIAEITDQPDVSIIMSDGCRLSARIWMPANALDAPVPAIVEHLPYRKRDGTIHRDELGHPYTAARGYACIRVDMRGNGESQGLMEDEYTLQEWQDACEVIRWASEQPWCSGSVGMMGISWGGFNSLQVAALKPPALKAIITVCSTVDRYADDIHYKGGCLLTENIGWAANMLSYSSRPPDPALVGEQYMDLWMQRLNNMPFLASTWLRHQSRDDYWRHGSVCENYSAIDAAVLSVGGWHDGYRNTISHLVSHLSCPVKGIVGPWIHKYPHYAQPSPAIGFLQESLRWWDHWLKGIDTGVEHDPDYRVYVMDSVKPARWLDSRPGRWIAEADWPSPRIHWQPWHIHTTDNNHSLVNEPATCAMTVNTPQNCGVNTGEYFPFTFGPELPDDQRDDDAVSVCADSMVLSNAIELVGAPAVTVNLSADKTTGLLVVRLCDLRPDGSSALITSGMLNLQHRETFAQPANLTPGKTYQVRVDLDQIAYLVPEGHQLRVSLSTSYWPFIWPAADNTTLSITKASINLPVRLVTAETPVAFPPAETSTPWQVEVLRKSSTTRDVVYEQDSRRTITIIDNDFGENLDVAHGLKSGEHVHERWSVIDDDPLSATADIRWLQTGGRGDWQWQSEATVNMHCDAQYFYVSATLSVTNNDSEIFSKTYSDKIERIAV